MLIDIGKIKGNKNMSCWGSECETKEPDGVCPVCGEDTVDGESVNKCSYSPTLCDVCGYGPCDGSC